MAAVQTPVRCRIAGEGAELEPLRRLARLVGSEDRIDFLGFVSDEDALELYASALAVYYAPLDEDYGFATVEAMKCRKPVLTTSDSGGVLEFVRDGTTGFVTTTGDAAALAQRMDELYADRTLAQRLGEAAAQVVAPIGWGATIERLLEA
jgi:glycosyltransferase involved in cell wall biosynthesis